MIVPIIGGNHHGWHAKLLETFEFLVVCGAENTQMDYFKGVLAIVPVKKINIYFNTFDWGVWSMVQLERGGFVWNQKRRCASFCLIICTPSLVYQ